MSQQDKTTPAPGSPGALARLRERFGLLYSPVSLGGLELRLPELENPQKYLEARIRENGEDSLPYWTKLWPAALALADYAARLPLDKGPVLELGAGLGLPGLAAAAAGHQVTISDLEDDALEFARAAVEYNDLTERARVLKLDWTDPGPEVGRFATILGAEILYQPEFYPLIVEVLPKLMARGGTVFISHEERPFAIGFFDLAAEKFTIRRASRTMHGPDGETKVFLYALQLKG